MVRSLQYSNYSCLVSLSKFVYARVLDDEKCFGISTVSVNIHVY